MHLMKSDEVDLIVRQWNDEKRELDASPLHILSRLFRVTRRFQRDAATLLKEFDLEYWEFDVLAALLRHGKPHALPAAKLSEVCLSSQGAMTNRVDRLIDRQLVERQVVENDRRKVLVSLTKKGKSVANAAVSSRLRLAKDELAILSPAEIQNLEKLLRKLM